MTVRVAVLLLLIGVEAVLCSQYCPTNFSSAEPIQSQFFGKHFIQFTSKDGDYTLRNVIKYLKLSVLQQNSNVTFLCVAFHDTTSYTSSGSDDNIAWVTFNTDPTLAAGIVSVETDCWVQKRNMESCGPVFRPLPGVMTTALYIHSPLSSAFWDHLKDEDLFKKGWVNRMNTQTKQGNILSSWVPGLQFGSLHYLQIKGNNWDRPDTLLDSLPSLTRLDLTDNNLQQLPTDIFNATPKLQDLLLAKNNMSVFPKGLESLPSLRLLDITNPKGRAELVISDSQISTIKQVQVLGLENINLHTNITHLLISSNLKFLNLSGCGINEIDDIELDGMQQNLSQGLEVLDLSKNNIGSVPNNLLSTLKKLKVLYLQGNELQSCPTLYDMVELTYIDLSNNRLSEFNISCFGSNGKKIVYLDLSGNKISQLFENAFQYLPSLRTMKLSNNKLTSLSSNFFLGLKNLRKLDLSHNLLSLEIYFENMKIDELNLSHNQFQNLSTFITSDTTIRSIDFSRNNISEWSIFVPVQILNLSHNSFSILSDDDVANLNNLESVDLGGNHFDCCSKNLSVIKSWLRSTEVNILNLGTKSTLKCYTHESNQKYPIKNFVYEAELCSSSHDSVPVNNDGINPNLFYSLVSVLSVALLALGVGMAFMLYVSRGCRPCTKAERFP